MKNKLLNNLISAYVSAEFLADLFKNDDDKKKERYASKHLALWHVLFTTYGTDKMRKLIDEYKATQGR